MRVETRPVEHELSPPPFRSDRFLMVGLSVAAVWVSVCLASLFAPDLVSGAEQDHVPIAAMTMWLQGVFATAFVLMTGAMGRNVDGRWRALALMVGAIWTVVAAASIWAPNLVSGSDGTVVPLAALVAPVAATIATAFVCLFVAGSARQEPRVL
jgi:hypothetical protein